MWVGQSGTSAVHPRGYMLCFFPGKAAAAAADPNAAWAAYYSHYYQQPPGPVPGQPPAPAAPPVQGEPPQPPPTGQSDYTKAWEEYYKKIGRSPAWGGGRVHLRVFTVPWCWFDPCSLSSDAPMVLPHNLGWGHWWAEGECLS